VIVIWSISAGHGPAGLFDVSVNVTKFAIRSFTPGEYVDVSELASLNTPSPEVVQVTETVLPPLVPANVIVLVSQTV
jgi:hypothetical protein